MNIIGKYMMRFAVRIFGFSEYLVRRPVKKSPNHGALSYAGNQKTHSNKCLGLFLCILDLCVNTAKIFSLWNSSSASCEIEETRAPAINDENDVSQEHMFLQYSIFIVIHVCTYLQQSIGSTTKYADGKL